MFYFKVIVLFNLIFFIFCFFYIKIRKISKNKKKIKNIERKLISKTSKKYSLIYYLYPKLGKILISIKNNKDIEKGLLDLLLIIKNSIRTGISINQIISKNINKLNIVIRNRMLIYLTISKDLGVQEAIKNLKERDNNIFLKLFWSVIYQHFSSGSSIHEEISNLYKIILFRINTKRRIGSKLIQTKAQIIIAVILPYFLTLVIKLLYPNMMEGVFNTPLGQKILFFSFFLHILGIMIFIKMIKFNTKKDLNLSIILNYISFNLKNGKSIISSFIELNSLNMLKIKKTNSLLDIIKELEKSKNNDLMELANVLKDYKLYGIPISGILEEKANNILSILEDKAIKFEQLAPIKALIPMFLFIFPATYMIMLSSIIVSLVYS